MAKAGYWAVTDAEERKRGERTGLDTLVVHAVNEIGFTLLGGFHRWCMVVVSSCREMLG